MILHLIPYCCPEDDEPLVAIGITYLLEVTDLAAAWATPGGPEVDEDIVTLADIVAETNCLIGIIDTRKVDELCSGLRSFLTT